ncbi:inactive rhomboid protein 1-like isoform X1 [Pecten maximus]|uniref:inactive rhomboid protein 1-like isoform X1 n=1 Tax=Pecten maximus TaxID=6579 RepID=UPI001458DEFD|nr:inactive rhomboid protein 1-like isoform X1 [Pecten maximus]
MPRNYQRQNTYDPNIGMTYDRQISRMTTASAPARGAGEEDEEEPSTMSRVGRKIKTSIADFFGVGEEDASKSQRWNNRRMRFYHGKYREDKMPGKDQADSDDVLGDMSAVPHVYDPLRNPARHSEYSSRRTTPLSSTSTYARSRGPPKRPRKESVVKMTVKSIAGARKKLRGKPSVQRQRSFAPASLAGEYPDDLSASMIYHSYDDAFSLVDDVFYDEPAFSPEMRMEKIGEDAEMEIQSKGWRPAHRYGHVKSHQMDEGVPHFGMKRIDNVVRDDLEDQDKRQIGMGFVGRLFNRSYRSDRLSSYVKSQIDDFDDHRPYFTYWVTIVQILCFIVSVAVYGIAPIGTGETVKTEYVMMPNLAIENIRYVENDNLWIGPRQADLIHLGAKYSPCMRRDENIWDGIGKDRAEENTSGCCVRDDGSGCTQTVKDLCEPTLNTFMKWNSSNPGKGGFIAGAVCGQDPNYCTKPASVEPFVWDKNSITNWPYCEQTSRPSSNTTVVSEGRHMTCEISGRPCCYGIQGECMITTREHCDFIKGYYHEDKYLCAQVNCMTEICGMIPFSDDSAPDQFYRLWTSMFLHGGVFHLVITIGFQFLIMRDIEKLTGCIRMAIIYVGSGIAGNLASSIFLPYHVEVGPAGAQFGILACLLVEVLQNVQMLKRPIIAILKIGGFILFLFLLGLLPWIDNWAHISGFLFGFLLAFALIPYVSFGQWDRRRKIIGIVLSLGGATALFITLIVLFYVLPLYNCPGCQYFNCIPFTTNFCKNMEVGIDRESTYSSNL